MNQGRGMRIMLAALAVTVLTTTVHAAGGHRGRDTSNPDQQKADQQKKKAIDDAYKSAVGKIPSPTQKYDPWRNAR